MDKFNLRLFLAVSSNCKIFSFSYCRGGMEMCSCIITIVVMNANNDSAMSLHFPQ